MAPRGHLALLTLSDGLVLAVGQRGHQEAHLGHGAPVVQDANAPHARTQRLVERRAVVGELSVAVNQDVVGGGDDVGGVNPHHGDSDICTFAPLLHSHCLVHGAQQSAKVPEHALFGIPLSANLIRESEKTRRAMNPRGYSQEMKNRHKEEFLPSPV